MENKNFINGLVRSIPNDAAESRSIPFILSNSKRDRHNTVLNQNKWKLDNYRKNPVVMYMHSDSLFGSNPDPDYVIGHDKKTIVEGSGNNAILTGILQFDPADVNLLAEKIFRKVLLGTLRACSVSFIEIGRGSFGKGDEAKGSINETFYFEGQELLEWSVVNIPSNPGTGKRFIKNTTLPGIMYCLSSLGKNFTRSQIEDMPVGEALNLLDGKDLEIRSKDAHRVARLLNDSQARKEQDRLIEMQQYQLKNMILNSK